MTDLPFISIITPTYNRAHTLDDCIQSVLQQSFANYELLIIDDGSVDDTTAIVSAYKDSRITFISLDKHTGNLSYLRNFGISKSQGDFIAFLDSDDRWHPKKLEQQLRAIKNLKSGWSFTDVVEFNEHQVLRAGIYQRLKRKDGQYENLYQELIEGQLVIFPSSVLMAANCLDQVGAFDESLPLSDQAFLIRLANFYPSYFINGQLTEIRKHQQNMSIDPVYQESGHLEIIQSLKAAYQAGNISSKVFHQRIGKLYYGLGKVQQMNSDKHHAISNYKLAMHHSKLLSKIWIKTMFQLIKIIVGM